MSKDVKYSRKFKLDALNLLQESKSLSNISKSLSISVNTLYTWRRRYQIHGDKTFQGSSIRLAKNEPTRRTPTTKERGFRTKDLVKKALNIFSKKDSVRYKFVQKHKAVYQIEKMCQVLHISHSSYYHWLNKKPSQSLIRRLELGAAIKNQR